MNLNDLIEILDQRYGNPYASKTCYHIQEAVKELRRLQAENEELRKAQQK